MAYIDVDKLLSTLPDDLPYKASVKRVLMQAPEADVVEVKHGKWRVDKNHEDYDCDIIKCSCCNEIFFPPDNQFTFDSFPKFCSECGSKMDGERKRK